jgi:uncharacterized coiled-coil protein SlyX
MKGRCEVVGLPRLDEYLDRPKSEIRNKGPFRLLVATATTPAFDERQSSVVLQSLQALRDGLADWQQASRTIDVIWRLNPSLHEQLGIPGPCEVDRAPLIEVVDQVDAVITTPSTIYLESALCDRPTAVLDFHNTPSYVPAAWTINCRDQIGGVLKELMNPPEARMLFQRQVLVDQLECGDAAKTRMLKLVEAMVAERQSSVQELRGLRFPSAILGNHSPSTEGMRKPLDMAALYPDESAFEQLDVRRLQVELASAIQRLGQLPAELADKNRYIAQLNQAADRLRRRIEEMHNRIVALRKRFGVRPAKPPVAGRNVLEDPQESGDQP